MGIENALSEGVHSLKKKWNTKQRNQTNYFQNILRRLKGTLRPKDSSQLGKLYSFSKSSFHLKNKLKGKHKKTVVAAILKAMSFT